MRSPGWNDRQIANHFNETGYWTLRDGLEGYLNFDFGLMDETQREPVVNRFLITMQYDEEFLLPIFINHYSKHIPLKNIFVIDHGSAVDLVPPGVNRIYVPRDRPFSEVDRLNLVKHISAGLLKYYDYGIYADCDELIALQYFSEDQLKDSEAIYVAGFDVYVGGEEKNSNKQLMGLVNPNECKPLIFKTVPDWGLGFHFSKKQLPAEYLEIPMAHVRFRFPEENSKRIETRRRVFQAMSDNEKKAGVDSHWQDGEKNYNEFTSRANFLKDSNSDINNFQAIERDKLFKRVKAASSSPINPYFYIQKGGYEIFGSRFDLTNIFSELI
jgi:hypothetical protein